MCSSCVEFSSEMLLGLILLWLRSILLFLCITLPIIVTYQYHIYDVRKQSHDTTTVSVYMSIRQLGKL